MSDNIYNTLQIFGADSETVFELIKGDSEIIDYNNIEVPVNSDYMNCSMAWGVPFNAWDTKQHSNYISFYSPSVTPILVITKLSKMFPEETFYVEYESSDNDNYNGNYRLKCGKEI